MEIMMNEDHKKILKDLGVENPEEDLLTGQELQWIFVGMGEGLLIS
jgi:hypothetical protein